MGTEVLMARTVRSGLLAAAVLSSFACTGSGGNGAPDTAPPTISIVSPVADDTVTTAAVLLRALVDDAGGVATVEYAVDAGPLAPMPAASGGYEVSVPLPL